MAAGVLVAACATSAAATEEAGLPWDALREALADEGDAEAGDGSGVDAAELVEGVIRDAAAFREHPVDVNVAGIRDLLRVPFMDPGAALRIVTARSTAGGFAAIEDLVARGCLAPDAFAAVRPYVTVAAPGRTAAPGRPEEPACPDSSGAVTDLDDPWRWSALSRATLAAGGASAPGGPGTFVRLRLSRGDALAVGIACEKDQGEDSLADHTALCAEWQALRLPLDVRVGLGDLAVSWAQGLIAGPSGIATIGGYPARRDRLRGYDGAAETSARRGVFASVGRGPLTTQVFLARTRLDASLDESGLVTSLRTSGWHRTDGELSGRAALKEEAAGVRLTLAPGVTTRVGVTAVTFEYDPPFADGDPERQRFRFSGSGLNLGGVDALVSGETWRAGCEVALTDGGAVAGVAAAKVRFGRATAALGAAHLAGDYWSPLGGGAPCASGGTNGTGAWLRAEYRSDDGTRVWCEGALSRRPWRSYLNELPDGRRSASLGVERALGALGRASLTLRETLCSTEGGDPVRSTSEWSRLVRADWRSAGEPEFSMSVMRATASVDSVVSVSGGEVGRGSALIMAVRLEASLGERARLDTGILAVSREGDAPSIVQYEPRLSGEFGLVSLNAGGARWYARLRSGLRLGVGLTVRVAGGPERGRVEAGVGIEVGG